MREGTFAAGPAVNGAMHNQSRPPMNRPQPRQPLVSGQNGANNAEASNTGRSVAPQQQPRTPNNGFTRSNSGAGTEMLPPQDAGQTRAVKPVAGRVLNQPSRTGPPSAPVSPGRQIGPSGETELPPQGAGFFSARAATMLPQSEAPGAPPPLNPNLPAFNPLAESPSIRKTEGVDHKTSKPLTRELKHLSGLNQPPTTAAPGPGPRANLVNPQLDATRRIGAPGSPSPMANRGMYKPPTMKRPVDGNGGSTNGLRAPLVDLPGNGTLAVGDAGGDVKRQRIGG